MDLREKAERALVTRLLADSLLAEAKLLAEQVAHEMRELGTDRVTVTDPGNLAQLGKLTKNPDRMVWGITDPTAFKAWVTAHRPDMLTTAVNPTFVAWVLKEAEAADGVVGDPDTGQVIPGIGQEKRIGTFVVNKTAEAKKRAAAVIEQMMSGGVAALPPAVKE